MPIVPSLNSFSAGTTAVASQVNSNFTNIRDTINTYAVLNDVANTITVTHNWNATQTFTPAASYAINVVQGGINITAGGLTVASGNIALTAGSLTFGAASAKIVPGATSFLIRNNADNASNVAITDAGAVTVRAGLTVTAGGLTVTAGGLTVSSGATSVQALTLNGDVTQSAATSKLLAGATSFTIKDSGDSVNAIQVSGTGTSTAVAINTGTGNAAAIFLGTNGSTQKTSNDNGGFPLMPYMSGVAPTGNPGASRVGCFCFANGKIYVWNGSAWVATATLT